MSGHPVFDLFFVLAELVGRGLVLLTIDPGMAVVVGSLLSPSERTQTRVSYADIVECELQGSFYQREGSGVAMIVVVIKEVGRVRL